MATDNYAKDLIRRDFLIKSGKAALAVGGGLTLDTLISGCASSLKETSQDVARIEWDCNPILPIPAEGCYTGTNYQPAPFVSRYSRTPDGRMLLTAHPPGEREEERVIDGFLNRYGILPTFHAIGVGRHGASNDHFPENICRAAVQRGVIPVIRHVVIPFDDCYKQVIKGKFDDKFRKFAADTARFEYPVVLVPFQLANDPDNRWFHWAGYPSGQYKDAWIRMHGIFQKEGANRNTIWSSKMKMGMWRSFSYPDPFRYLPESPYIDIIGWGCNNHSKPDIGLYSMSFDALFSYYYDRASRLFPRKPQMFWELSTPYGPEQASWLDNALSAILIHYRKVKGVMLDEQYEPGIGNAFGSFNPTPTPDSIQVIKKHFNSPHYKGILLNKG